MWFIDDLYLAIPSEKEEITGTIDGEGVNFYKIRSGRDYNLFYADLPPIFFKNSFRIKVLSHYPTILIVKEDSGYNHVVTDAKFNLRAPREDEIIISICDPIVTAYIKPARAKIV